MLSMKTTLGRIARSLGLWLLNVGIAAADPQGMLNEERRYSERSGGGGDDALLMLVAVPLGLIGFAFMAWIWKGMLPAMGRALKAGEWGEFFALLFIWLFLCGGILVPMIAKEIIN